jgi:hypothetical protein
MYVEANFVLCAAVFLCAVYFMLGKFPPSLPQDIGEIHFQQAAFLPSRTVGVVGSSVPWLHIYLLLTGETHW